MSFFCISRFVICRGGPNPGRREDALCSGLSASVFHRDVSHANNPSFLPLIKPPTWCPEKKSSILKKPSGVFPLTSSVLSGGVQRWMSFFFPIPPLFPKIAPLMSDHPAPILRRFCHTAVPHPHSVESKELNKGSGPRTFDFRVLDLFVWSGNLPPLAETIRQPSSLRLSDLCLVPHVTFPLNFKQEFCPYTSTKR